jgi:hypothetical protein
MGSLSVSIGSRAACVSQFGVPDYACLMLPFGHLGKVGLWLPCDPGRNTIIREVT